MGLGCLDWVCLYVLLDHFTSSYPTAILSANFNFLIWAYQCSVTQWLLSLLVAYRIGMISWQRYKIGQKLSNKRASILERHSQLSRKLTDTCNYDTLSSMKANELSVGLMREKLKLKTFSTVDLIDYCQTKALETGRGKSGDIAELITEAEVYAMISDAKLDEDIECDDYFTGIPVALDETLPIQGYDHTAGFTGCTGRPANRDCNFVASLKQIGLVPFVRTSSQQLSAAFSGIGCHLQAYNPLYGPLVHPTHPGRVTLSGAAGVVSRALCPVAFTTDIVGQGRLSAAYCGLCCLKPSCTRVSRLGIDLPLHLAPCLGVVPIALTREVQDLVKVMRRIWRSGTELSASDVTLHMKPFDEATYESCFSGQKLRIGYLIELENLVPVSGSCARVVNESIQFLEDLGHEIVSVSLPETKHLLTLTYQLLNTTIRPEILSFIYGKSCGDTVASFDQRLQHLLFAMPSWTSRRLIDLYADQLEHSYPLVSVILKSASCNASLYSLLMEVDKCRQDFFEAWSNQHQIDILLCPASPIPAPFLNSIDFEIAQYSYAFVAAFSLLDCPIGVVCPDVVSEADISCATRKQDEHSPLYRAYDRIHETGGGLSIGLQVVGKPGDDETVLSLMTVLEAQKARLKA